MQTIEHLNEEIARTPMVCELTTNDGRHMAMFALPGSVNYGFTVEWWDERGEFHIEFMDTIGL